MEQMLIGDISAIWRTVIVGVLAYGVLLLFLRVSGKRTLSKMNAFDFVVTVALGSTLATILLGSDVSLLQGAVALGLLILLQFLITWTSVRAQWLRRAVTGEPALLLSNGRLLHDALRKNRVTEEEIHAAARAAGEDELARIRAVVLETDGSFSIIPETASDRPNSS